MPAEYPYPYPKVSVLWASAPHDFKPTPPPIEEMPPVGDVPKRPKSDSANA